MGNIIIIDEFAHGIIVTSPHKATGNLLRIEFLLISWLVGRIRRVATDHLVPLSREAFSLHHLYVFQSAEDLMLDDEDGFHLEIGAFFYVIRFCLRFCKVDCDFGSIFDFLEAQKAEQILESGQNGRVTHQRELLYHTGSRIVRIADGLT